MFAIGVWLLCSFGVGLLAHLLGRVGIGWTIFSLAFSPSLGLLLVAVLGKNTPRVHRTHAPS